VINKRKERGADGKEDVKKKSWKENEGSVRGMGRQGRKVVGGQQRMEKGKNRCHWSINRDVARQKPTNNDGTRTTTSLFGEYPRKSPSTESSTEWVSSFHGGLF